MQKIDALEHHHTSLSLRVKSCRSVTAARKILRRNGLTLSESEILTSLAKEYLKRWRGEGKKSATPRRYNVEAAAYRIRPWYVNRVLYSALWERGIHSGESVSRMVDFAVRFYLPRLLEVLLRVRRAGVRQSPSNIAYWARRSMARKRAYREVFINYQCKTYLNHAGDLIYMQVCTQVPKKGLSPAEIQHWNRTAA